MDILSIVIVIRNCQFLFLGVIMLGCTSISK